MDLQNDSNQQSSQDTPSLQSELAHVTEEMYKKNVELNLSNKTLSLLRKIDLIILSSVIDPKQIAKQVANAIVKESDFWGLVVYMFDSEKLSLVPLADSYSEATQEEKIYAEELPLHSNNPITKAFMDKKAYLVQNLSDLVIQPSLKRELEVLQKSAVVESSVVLPLIVRGDGIGVIAIMLGEQYEKLNQSEKDIIERLGGVVGIALDNALLYKEIQEVNEKLKQLDKLKDEFVSLASHELRTPMTVIKSYIWMLLEGKVGELSEKQRQYLERTYVSTDRLINMVNDMLNISRIESGRLTIEPKQLSMTSLIQEVVGEMQTRAGEQQLVLVFSPPQEEIPSVFADSDKIKQVLINLIGNSLKFTPQGGKITLICEQKDGYILTHVKDTGKGIKAEDMDKLFRKFNMLGSNYLTKQTGQGTGLGLYLSKSLVELHKGRIWVTSEGEGKGTTFSFALPVIAQEQTAKPEQEVVKGTV